MVSPSVAPEGRCRHGTSGGLTFGGVVQPLPEASIGASAPWAERETIEAEDRGRASGFGSGVRALGDRRRDRKLR